MVKLDQYEMAEMLIELFSRFSPEEMRTIKEHDLTRRIDKILVLEAVAGTLNDLTPEEIAIFDAAVAGK
jgi:ATP-dependent helicase/DNAse subunit B